MKYKNYEGSAEELIRQKLQEIEAKENVKILHAVESGSRAWGFASPDSDYDVRFIYVRPKDWYLSLQDKKDYIEWELDEVLDINGWDLTKALQHFHRSNATLYEWSNSPLVYYTTPEWTQIRDVSEHYFSCKSCIHHYYGTAIKNYQAHLLEEQVKYKKYFYVLRPVLSCKWIIENLTPPPVLFSELMNSVLEDEMKPVIQELLQAKVKMNEYEKGPRMDAVNDYIVRKLTVFKEGLETMEDDRNRDWGALNELFRNMLY